MDAEKIYLFPQWLRLWHALNALFCLVLVVSGGSMYFSSAACALIRFDHAVTLHIIAGLGLAASYIVFVAGNIFSKNGDHYRLDFRGFVRKFYRQVRYYVYGMFRREEPPFPVSSGQKFNPVQQLTYVSVMYIMVPLLIASGSFMLLADDHAITVAGVNGTLFLHVLHVCSGMLIVVFLMVHLYFATLGRKPASHYRSMITGYHEPNE